jgi:hypothetical protein
MSFLPYLIGLAASAATSGGLSYYHTYKRPYERTGLPSGYEPTEFKRVKAAVQTAVNLAKDIQKQSMSKARKRVLDGDNTAMDTDRLPGTGGLAPLYSGSVQTHFYRKFRRIPRDYIGSADYTHYDDEIGTSTSLGKEQKFSSVYAIMTKDKIQGSNLGLDDFIDIDTADIPNEQLHYLIHTWHSEIIFKNMQTNGAFMEVYLAIARRANNATPTDHISEGIHSEAASAGLEVRPGIKPWDSETFNRMWKVKKRWKHFINPGDHFKINLFFEINKVMNVADLARQADAHEAGLTWYLFLRHHGQLASEDGAPSEVGMTTSRISWYINQKISFRVLYNENWDKMAFETTALDTLTTPKIINTETHQEAAVETL